MSMITLQARVQEARAAGMRFNNDLAEKIIQVHNNKSPAAWERVMGTIGILDEEERRDGVGCFV